MKATQAVSTSTYHSPLPLPTPSPCSYNNLLQLQPLPPPQQAACPTPAANPAPRPKRVVLPGFSTEVLMTEEAALPFFKNLQPPCIHCGSSSTHFRYFNNKRRCNYTIQPRYACHGAACSKTFTWNGKVRNRRPVAVVDDDHRPRKLKKTEGPPANSAMTMAITNHAYSGTAQPPAHMQAPVLVEPLQLYPAQQLYCPPQPSSQPSPSLPYDGHHMPQQYSNPGSSDHLPIDAQLFCARAGSSTIPGSTAYSSLPATTEAMQGEDSLDEYFFAQLESLLQPDAHELPANANSLDTQHARAGADITLAGASSCFTSGAMQREDSLDDFMESLLQPDTHELPANANSLDTQHAGVGANVTLASASSRSTSGALQREDSLDDFVAQLESLLQQDARELPANAYSLDTQHAGAGTDFTLALSSIDQVFNAPSYLTLSDWEHATLMQVLETLPASTWMQEDSHNQEEFTAENLLQQQGQHSEMVRQTGSSFA